MKRQQRLVVFPFACILWLMSSPSAAPQTTISAIGAARTTLHDGQHDFDFELGSWKTHLQILTHTQSGDPKWVEYDGTSIVHSIWGGRANIVELEVGGPTGHVEAINLRLYNPASHQWSLNFANAAGGTLGVPTVGEFNNGRGEFYDFESIKGRMMLVRNIWSGITAERCHFEQAFSEDGGRTWETNWIADDTRLQAPASSSSW